MIPQQTSVDCDLLLNNIANQNGSSALIYIRTFTSGPLLQIPTGTSVQNGEDFPQIDHGIRQFLKRHVRWEWFRRKKLVTRSKIKAGDLSRNLTQSIPPATYGWKTLYLQASGPETTVYIFYRKYIINPDHHSRIHKLPFTLSKIHVKLFIYR